jgi:hypothetical protein
MQLFLTLAALLWALCGVAVLASAKSAIHEILGCLAVSFGVMFLGLAGIIAHLRKLSAAGAPHAAAPSPKSAPTIEQAIDQVRARAGR